MAAYGLLIDYEYCTGCSSCIVSCKEEHGYPVGKWGIRVFDDGPWPIDDKHFNWNRIPTPTDLCDLCVERTSIGKEPICVHHCLANVLSYGPVAELAKKLEDKPKQALFVPKFKPFEDLGRFESKKAPREARHIEVDIKANEDFEIAIRRDKSVETFIQT
ncbi:MAG: hypothetical protein LBH64_05480 [Coriobacteriales bacterium]|jgi:anaerobic dimethyl sulfoxide reductase subunit B (iron-sulfur subunit)|nr:hypothetical protein [Coriobacteriales bacterium]